MCRNCLEQIQHLENLDKKKQEESRKKSLGIVKKSLRTERMEEPAEKLDDVDVKYAMRGSYNSMPNPNSLSVVDESCSYMHIPF